MRKKYITLRNGLTSLAAVYDVIGYLLRSYELMLLKNACPTASTKFNSPRY